MACRAGRQDFCYTGKFTERGIKQRNGFMTEFIVDEERYAVPVPPESQGHRHPDRADDDRREGIHADLERFNPVCPGSLRQREASRR